MSKRKRYDEDDIVEFPPIELETKEKITNDIKKTKVVDEEEIIKKIDTEIKKRLEEFSRESQKKKEEEENIDEEQEAEVKQSTNERPKHYTHRDYMEENKDKDQSFISRIIKIGIGLLSTVGLGYGAFSVSNNIINRPSTDDSDDDKEPIPVDKRETNNTDDVPVRKINGKIILQ